MGIVDVSNVYPCQNRTSNISILQVPGRRSVSSYEKVNIKSKEIVCYTRKFCFIFCDSPVTKIMQIPENPPAV